MTVKKQPVRKIVTRKVIAPTKVKDLLFCHGCGNSCANCAPKPPVVKVCHGCGNSCANCAPKPPVPPTTLFRGCGDTCVKGKGCPKSICSNCNCRGQLITTTSRQRTLMRFTRGKTYATVKSSGCKSCKSHF